MKKTVIIISIIVASVYAVSAQNLWPSFDFKSANVEGDTLYYRITSTTTPTVAVTRCHDSVYHNLPFPTMPWEMGQSGFVYPLYDYDSYVVIPSTVEFEGQTFTVTAIDKEAFYMQKNLQHVVLPNTIETIDTGAFHHSMLNQIEMSSNVKRINFYAFSQIPLSSIELPESLTHIGVQAFASSGIKEVNIPAGVSILPYQAFYSCPLTDIAFNDGLREIHECAFSPEHIDTLAFPPSLVSIEQLTYDYLDDTIECRHVVFQQGTEPLVIGKNCFQNFINLKTMVLPDNLVSVGPRCFSNTGLIEIDLPDGIDSISSNCFSYCESLDSVSLPSNLKRIEKLAFYETPMLKKITIPQTVEYIGNSAFRSSLARGLEEVNIFCETPPSISPTTFNKQDTILVRVPCEKIDEYQAAPVWNTYDNLVFEDCVGIENVESGSCKVYPIPADKYINIELDEFRSEYKIEIVNIYGQCVYGESLNSGKASVDISSLSKGIYLINIFDKKGLLCSKKLIKA